jgi:uncharacterized protein (DUF58 family)
MKWLVGALLILLIALVFNLGLLAYAMYALLGVLVTSWLLARAWSENLVAKRGASRLTATVGDRVNVSVTIENKGRLPVGWLLMEDLLPKRALQFEPPNLGVDGKRLQLAMLRPHGTKTLTYDLCCNQRGYYQIGPTVLETGDWFGLHRRYRVAAEPHFLLVYPRVVPLEGFELASRRPIGEVRVVHRLFEDPTRVGGVRQYQTGDPMNRVHWRATARTGELHSKVYEPSSVAGATILLDFHEKRFEPRYEPYRSELAVMCAASIANAVYELNQQIGLVTSGRDAVDRIRQEGWDFDYRSRDAAKKAAAMLDASDRLQPLVVPTRRGPEQFMRILETLARVELTDGLTFAELVTETDSRLPRDATVIAMLTNPTPEDVLVLGNLRRRGFAVTAILSVYDDHQYSHAAGRLLAEGIESRHLRDENSVVAICRRIVVR